VIFLVYPLVALVGATIHNLHQCAWFRGNVILAVLYVRAGGRGSQREPRTGTT
jgi:hypothetical protein